jgi:hypothetical protein
MNKRRRGSLKKQDILQGRRKRTKKKSKVYCHFVTTLLVKFSAYSSSCCKITSRIYSAHGKGTRQPSNGSLRKCFQEMLSADVRLPIYLITDAPDEYLED